MGKSLTVIVKTVERCNLNCSYCYFFNGLDKSYKKRPKFISKLTIDNLIMFLDNAIKIHGVDDLVIGLHGGEPLMQPKSDFIYFVENIPWSIINVLC